MSARNPAPLGPVVREIEPPPRGCVRTVTDTDMNPLREGVKSGLLSGSEADLYRSLRPASRGAGRDRWRS